MNVPRKLVLLTLAVLTAGMLLSVSYSGAEKTAQLATSATVEMVDAWSDKKYDWEALAQGGVKATFMRKSRSVDQEDPDFAKNWKAAKDAGLIRGAFHRMLDAGTPEEQAELFLKGLKLEAGDLPPILDIEPDEETFVNYSKEERTRRAQIWLDIVEKQTGMVPIIYTGAYFLPQLTGIESWSRYPLWLADWHSNNPSAPAPWNTVSFHQYDCTKRLQAVSGGNVDVCVTRFNGSLEQLRQMTKFGGLTLSLQPSTMPQISSSQASPTFGILPILPGVRTTQTSTVTSTAMISTTVPVSLSLPLVTEPKELTDFPFVIDQRQSFTRKGGYPMVAHNGVLWHQTAIASMTHDRAANYEGVDLAKAEGGTPGYHVLVGRKTMTIGGVEYAVAYQLLDESWAAMHNGAVDNASKLAISFVDAPASNENEILPAQQRTMEAITAYWMKKYNFSASAVSGHKERSSVRSDPVGVNMDQLRKKLADQRDQIIMLASQESKTTLAVTNQLLSFNGLKVSLRHPTPWEAVTSIVNLNTCFDQSGQPQEKSLLETVIDQVAPEGVKTAIKVGESSSCALQRGPEAIKGLILLLKLMGLILAGMTVYAVAGIFPTYKAEDQGWTGREMADAYRWLGLIGLGILVYGVWRKLDLLLAVGIPLVLGTIILFATRAWLARRYAEGQNPWMRVMLAGFWFRIQNWTLISWVVLMAVLAMQYPQLVGAEQLATDTSKLVTQAETAIRSTETISSSPKPTSTPPPPGVGTSALNFLHLEELARTPTLPVTGQVAGQASICLDCIPAVWAKNVRLSYGEMDKGLSGKVEIVPGQKWSWNNDGHKGSCFCSSSGYGDSGNGVCQAATVFNVAAVKAGLQTIRRDHVINGVGYVPIKDGDGKYIPRNQTVVIWKPGTDLVVVNNTAQTAVFTWKVTDTRIDVYVTFR